jgi:hypothetical protein
MATSAPDPFFTWVNPCQLQQNSRIFLEGGRSDFTAAIDNANKSTEESAALVARYSACLNDADRFYCATGGLQHEL